MLNVETHHWEHLGPAKPVSHADQEHTCSQDGDNVKGDGRQEHVGNPWRGNNVEEAEEPEYGQGWIAAELCTLLPPILLGIPGQIQEADAHEHYLGQLLF